MTTPALGATATRAVFLLFNVFASLYCALAYVPFAFHQIHKGGLFAGLDRFAEWHRWLNLAVLGLVVPSLVLGLQRLTLARAAIRGGFLGLQAIWAMFLVVNPVLPGLDNSSSSLLWSVPPLVSVVGLAVLDWLDWRTAPGWSPAPSNTAGIFAAAAGASVVVPLFYSALGSFRAGLGAADAVRSLFWSMSVHSVVFATLFLLLFWASTMARYGKIPAKTEFALCHLLAGAGLAAVLAIVAFRPLGFGGWQCGAYSCLLAGAIVSTHAALAARLSHWDGAVAERPGMSGLEAACAVLCLGRTGSVAAASIGMAALLGAGGLILNKAAGMDWNFLVQKLATAGLWLGCFGLLFSALHRRLPASPRWAPYVVATFAILGLYRKTQASLTPMAGAMDRYAGYDASFLFARELLAQPAREASIYKLMAANTNLGQSVKVAPVEIDFVDRFAASAGPAPHIFIVVVDSLRRDYLSPYNPKVEFTPGIAAFAREGVVFRNAFTRYGGTGLSEPSIWTGALMLHKQYVTPFAPMNTLEKLLRARNFEMRVSRDEILHTILGPPRVGDADLDKGRATMNLDLCATLDELGASADAPSSDNRSLFAYTQPQNLHVSTIQREGGRALDPGAYAGFHAPYASRLRRIDACFGRFVESLKSRGIYDSSVVVLTADHGDSLGEDGRWGHAYTLFPEIVRIPLIVHLPSALRHLGTDPDQVTFSSDISPTLHYLLGHPPRRIAAGGRPLFSRTPEERADPRAWHLIASSYAAVYGVLYESGRKMYVADGVNFKDYLFDLASTGAGSGLALTEAIRAEQHERIKRGILEVNELYRVGGAR